jgi:hypothetical protein
MSDELDLTDLGKSITTLPPLTYNRLQTSAPLEEPTGNLFSAIFFRDTTIGSFLKRPEATAFDPDKNMGLDFMEFVPRRHMSQFDAYALVTNKDEAYSVMRTLDEENERTALVASNPWKSFFYNFGLQPIDPANWLPGGVIFNNLKRMSRATKGALQAGAAGVISTAVQESFLQRTQLSREVDESIMNTAAGGLFSAAIGGVSPILGPKLKRFTNKNRERAKAEILDVFTEKEENLTPYKHGSSAAHISGNQLANMPKFVQKGMKTSISNDMLTSEFQAPKDVVTSVIETTYNLVKNEQGEATINAERNIVSSIRAIAPVLIEVDNLFYEQAGISSGFGKEMRANRAAKADLSGAILNNDAYQKAVSYTLFTATKHPNEAVNKAAALIRDKIFEPYKEALIALGELPKGATVQNAFDYFPVNWNQQKLKEDKSGFMKLTTDWMHRIDKVVESIHGNTFYQFAQQEVKDAKALRDRVRRVKRGMTPPETRKLEQQSRKLERELRRAVKNVAQSPEYRATEKEIRTLEHDIRKANREHRRANVKEMRTNLAELKKKLTQVKNSVKGFSGHTDYVSLGLDLKLAEAMRKEAHAEVVVKHKDLGSAKSKLSEARAKLRDAKNKKAPSLEVERLLDMEIEHLEDKVHTLEKEMKKEREKVTKHQADVTTIKGMQADIEKKLGKKAKAIASQTLREIKKYPEYKELVLDIKKTKEMIERTGTEPQNVKELRKKVSEKEKSLKELVRKVDKSPEYQKILGEIKDKKQKIKESKQKYSAENLGNLDEQIAVLEAEANKLAENLAGRVLDPDEIAAIFHQSEGKQGRLRKPVLDPDYIRLAAEQTYDRIIGNDIGGPSKAVVNKLNKRPASAKKRTFMIPQRLAFDWQNQNASEVAERYARAVIPVVRMTEIAHQLGYKSIEDWHNNEISKMNDELKFRISGLNKKDRKTVEKAFKEFGNAPGSEAYKIQADLESKSEGVKGKEADKLNKEFKKQEKNITSSFELILGIYGDGPNVHDNSASKYYKAFLNWNYVRLLGFMTLSAIPDIGMHVLTHGPFATLYHGLRPLLGDVFGTLKNMSKDDIQAMGYALETVKGTRLKSMAGHEGLSTQPSFFGRTFDKMVETFGNFTFMNQWNDTQQVIAGTMSINRTLKSIEAWHNGTITKEEITRLARLGIDKGQYQSIYDMWVKSGKGNEGGTYFANWVTWDPSNHNDRGALEAFKRATAKEIDSVVIVPGLGDKPLIAHTNLGKLLLQFKSFAFTATNKILFSGIQRRNDANTYWGMATMLGLGAFSYAVTQAVRGNDNIDLSFSKLSREAIDRSGLLGILSEVYNMAEKAGLGFGTQASRYQSRSLWGALLGPSTGAFDEMFNLVNSIRKADGEHPLTTKDFEKILRLAPYQNLFYTYYLSRKVSGAVAKKLGFEEAQETKLKDMFK